MKGDKYICPLCGYELDQKVIEECGSCTSGGKSCSGVRCPKCGYRFPGESTVLNFFTKLFDKDKE